MIRADHLAILPIIVAAAVLALLACLLSILRIYASLLHIHRVAVFGASSTEVRTHERVGLAWALPVVRDEAPPRTIAALCPFYHVGRE